MSKYQGVYESAWYQEWGLDIDKLWAWGGMIGAKKGVEDMVSQSAVAVAVTIAQGKGWKPNRR